MHYKEFLKGYKVISTPQTPSVVQTCTSPNKRSDDDVELMVQYFDHLKDHYFNEIPYNEELIKKFVCNLPDNIFKYITKLLDIDAPITCQPLTMLYGMCINDIDAYPNFIKILVEYNVTNEADLVDYINANQQIIENDEGDDS